MPVTIGHDAANVPDGAEVIVSSAIAPDNPEVEGREVKRRGELLAELVELRPSIVVAGAHGKTTTAGMIAFCLDRLGNDPCFLIGGEIPQLDGNARAGEGWLVAEGDESDRSLELLRPRVAVLTNVELDHHATFVSEEEVRELFERWLASAPEHVRGDELEPVSFELAVPGEHNRRNAAAALAAPSWPGSRGRMRSACCRSSRGAGRRFEREARHTASGSSTTTDTTRRRSRRRLRPRGPRRTTAGSSCFQPHLYSRTRHLASALARSLAAADAVAVTRVYAAREEPVEGVDGKLIVDALAAERPGMPVAWMPGLEDAGRFLSRRARPGDLVLTIGAGDVGRAAPLILEELG